MGRSTKFSHSLLARVRAYYGLRQHEMATLLGVAEALVGHIEAGRRALTRAVHERLAPFLQQMVADEAEPLLTAPPPGPLDSKLLQARHAACLHEARNLRWAVRGLPEQARQAAHWAQALPGLLAALPPPPPADAPVATREEARLRYAHAWLPLATQELSPEDFTRWHMALARATALETEAAALAVLLAAQGIAVGAPD